MRARRDVAPAPPAVSRQSRAAVPAPPGRGAAGNRALQRALQPQRRVAAPAPGQVQRFPASVLARPYSHWDRDVAAVTSPGEGRLGGVFILEDGRQGTAIPKVVVKPLHQEGASQSQFGDAFLRSVGIDVPASRFVGKGPEFNQLSAHIGAGWQHKRDAALAVGEQLPALADAYGIKVMGAVAAPSLAARAVAAGQQPQKMAELKAILNKQAVWNAFGRMMVADAAIGNDDRIALRQGVPFFNLGNILASVGGDLWAIDTAAMLDDVDAYALAGQKLQKINPATLNALIHPEALRYVVEDLIETVARLVDSAVPAPAVVGGGPAPPSPGAEIRHYWQNNVGNFTAALGGGVSEGIARIERLLYDKDSRRERSALQEEASGRGYGDAAMSGRASWATLEGKWAGFTGYRAAIDPSQVAATKRNRAPQPSDITLPQAGLDAADRAGERFVVERAMAAHKLHKRIPRIVLWGLEHRLLTATNALKAVNTLGARPEKEQKAVVHVRGKAAKKRAAKAGINVDARLEATRVRLLHKVAMDDALGPAAGVAAELLALDIGSAVLSDLAAAALRLLGVPDAYL